MKKIIFLIIASLLVIGLVLPGCEGEGEEDLREVITIGVTGPLTFIQGEDHVAGAEMAANEINGTDVTTDGVEVGSTLYKIVLEEIETNEILDFFAGITALEAKIAGLDFIVGGFRTEGVINYREVAVGPDGAGVMFFNCGAATGALQMSVVDDYDNYKYWFKSTPYNEVFLVQSCLKYVGLINTSLRTALGLGPGNPAQLRMAVLMEDAEWCNPMLPFVIGFAGLVGINYTGVQKVESDAEDVSAELQALDADDPHMIFTILSGPPGKAYGEQQATYVPYAFSLGINVESQDITYHDETDAEYHMTLDTWAPNCAVTSGTVAWFDDFVAETGHWPTYCAATYDAINALVKAIEDTDSLSPDDLIPYIEETPYSGIGAPTTAYYPMPDIFLAAGDPGEFDTWALNYTQVHEIYPDYVPAAFNHTVLGAMYGPLEGLVCDTLIPYTGLPGQPCWTTTAGYIAHDTVYGPDYQTGIAVQWQEVEGEWIKVAIWPMDLGEGYDALLTDVHGNWNFEYPGTGDLAVPPAWIAKFGS